MHTYGSFIVHIDREQLASMPVPVPAADVRNEIGNLVLLANERRDKAWRLERSAIMKFERIIEGRVARDGGA